MRSLEVRRHSIRKAGAGSQLSQEGVALARRLGASMGPFARVVTSVSPRARETAVAMGFAVDHEIVTLVTDEDLYAESEAARVWEDSQPFAALARLVGQQGATRRYAHALSAIWRDELMALPDGAAALVIGHSGDLEMGLVACLPDANHAAWGALLAPCEGARLVFEGEPPRFRSIDLIRL